MKLIGRMVRIKKSRYPDPHEGQTGKVVCVVKAGRKKEYIVQFRSDWSFFTKDQLKIER